MSTNRNAIIRYQALDKCFSNFRRKFYIEDLITECNKALYDFTGEERYCDELNPGISRRQIYDDIRFMESPQGWDIVLDRKREGGKKPYYRYADQDFTINKQSLTEEELSLLRDTVLLLSRFEGLPHKEWLSELITNLDDKFNLSQPESVLILDSNPYARGMNYISELYLAIVNRQSLHIEYQTFTKCKYEWDIHPYFMREYNNRWFLIGLSDDDKEIKHIALDRIENISQANVEYIKKSIGNYSEFFDDVIGVTIPKDGKVETIKLRFSEHRYPYVIAKPIHSTMRCYDTERIVTIKVIPNKELISMILSFGNDVEVLEPQLLREEITRIIKSSYDKYS